MLNFDSFKKLDKHQKFIQKKCKTDNIFLVGWCIRDILLSISHNPTDIDFTMAGEPSEIYKNIDKKDISHFITEKFWTITLIPKNQKSNNEISEVKNKDLLQYELTPLRTENEYSDNRHPEKIQRQDNLILDSNRRDFTINCLYYFSTNLDKKLINIQPKVTRKKITNTSDIVKSLDKNWILFYQDQNLVVIQDHKYIDKLFAKGKFNKDFLVYLLDTLKDVYSKQKKSTENNIRIIIDPHHGIQDLINRKIKAVWDPNKRFTEDALRTIRALRFIAVLNQKLRKQEWNIVKAPLEGVGGKKIKAGNRSKVQLFDIETNTRSSLKEHTTLVEQVSKERIKDEMMKVFVSWDPFAFISLLDETKLLEYIFPALYKNKYIEQPVRYHPFDNYVHTMLTLYSLQKINTDYLTRFAMLYHDVWKAEQYAAYTKWLTRKEIREILSWPLNHRNSGPDLAKEDFSRLWFSKNEIKDISRYIAKHHTPGEILDAKPENRIKKLRKLYSEAGFEKVNNLIDITIADRLWQFNPMQNSTDITDVEGLRTLLKKLKKQEGQFTSSDLKVNWEIIMKYFDLKAWPQIWKLLKQAIDRVLSDIKNRNNKSEILKHLKWSQSK